MKVKTTLSEKIEDFDRVINIWMFRLNLPKLLIQLNPTYISSQSKDNFSVSGEINNENF